MVAYSVIMFVFSAVFLVIGILTYCGKTNLIHDYHQAKIKESEKKEYGKAFAKAMFCIALTLIISGAVALLGKTKYIVITSGAVLLFGIIISLALIVRVQKKYNGSIF